MSATEWLLLPLLPLLLLLLLLPLRRRKSPRDSSRIVAAEN
jgi:hypothetical protein